MNLMVYAKSAEPPCTRSRSSRARIIGEADAGAQISARADLIASLPKSNWWKRSENLSRQRWKRRGIFDTFLHPQDRAYTGRKLYA